MFTKMAKNIHKKIISIFFSLLQILQKICYRKKPKNWEYSRRLPPELIDESLCFLPYKKCYELSISSRNYCLRGLAKYRAEKASKKFFKLCSDPVLKGLHGILETFFNLKDWLADKKKRVEMAQLEHEELVELVLKMQKEMVSKSEYDSLKSEVDSLKAFKQKVEAQQLDGQSTSFISQTFHSFAAEHSNSPPSFSAHPSSSNVFSGQRTPLQLANFDEQQQMSYQTSSSSSTYGTFQPIRQIGDRRHSLATEYYQQQSPLPSSSVHLPSSSSGLKTPPPPAPQPPASSSAHFSSSSLISRRTSPLPKRKIVNKDYLMMPPVLRKRADE